MLLYIEQNSFLLVGNRYLVYRKNYINVLLFLIFVLFFTGSSRQHYRVIFSYSLEAEFAFFFDFTSI